MYLLKKSKKGFFLTPFSVILFLNSLKNFIFPIFCILKKVFLNIFFRNISLTSVFFLFVYHFTDFVY